MVDLGFLLITFFIFTTALMSHTTMPLAVPTGEGQSPVQASKSLTLLLGDNNTVYAYEGLWEEALRSHKIVSTNYTEEGMGGVIRAKQNWLDKHQPAEGRDELVLMIKPVKTSTYKNLVDALDEAVINDVKKYAVLMPSTGEIQFLSGK